MPFSWRKIIKEIFQHFPYKNFTVSFKKQTFSVGYFCVLKYFRSPSISFTFFEGAFFVQNFSAKNQKAERN